MKKPIHKLILPMAALLLGMLTANVSAQSASEAPPRLVIPIVIPMGAEEVDAGGMTSSPIIAHKHEQAVPPAEARAVQASAVPPTKPKVRTEIATPSASTSTGAIGSFGELTPPAASVPAAEAIKSTVTSPAKAAKAAREAEMIIRMRLAVEQIAAEYGSPTFAQVFTNDPVQAQVLRKRLQLLQRMETVSAEIASLEKQKEVSKSELDANRRELIALHEQSQVLFNRLQKARVVLGDLK